jgi:uncharacterized protein (TIGR02284 family)
VIKQQTIDGLNDLIGVCQDSEKGYQAASEHVHNSELSSAFADFAKQRAHFVRDLQAEVQRLGGTPSNSGSLASAVHRGWMDLKSALTGGDPGSIIASCESGEEAAMVTYDRITREELSGETKTLIDKQWRKIQEAHKHMLRLKEQSRSGVEFPKNE